MHTYQVDWFTAQIPIWEKHLNIYKGKEHISFIEIGSFEGRSAVWLLNNILTSPSAQLTCIDTFGGSIENQKKDHIDLSQIEKNFDANILQTGAAHKVIKIKDFSAHAFQSLTFNSYDVIYIDGSHTAPDVLSDGVLYFHLLKPGGIMIFDDYEWGEEGMIGLDTPKPAIDAFLSIYAKQVNILFKGIQVVISKN